MDFSTFTEATAIYRERIKNQLQSRVTGKIFTDYSNFFQKVVDIYPDSMYHILRSSEWLPSHSWARPI